MVLYLKEFIEYCYSTFVEIEVIDTYDRVTLFEWNDDEDNKYLKEIIPTELYDKYMHHFEIDCKKIVVKRNDEDTIDSEFLCNSIIIYVG